MNKTITNKIIMISLVIIILSSLIIAQDTTSPATQPTQQNQQDTTTTTPGTETPPTTPPPATPTAEGAKQTAEETKEKLYNLGELSATKVENVLTTNKISQIIFKIFLGRQYFRSLPFFISFFIAIGVYIALYMIFKSGEGAVKLPRAIAILIGILLAQAGLFNFTDFLWGIIKAGIVIAMLTGLFFVYNWIKYKILVKETDKTLDETKAEKMIELGALATEKQVEAISGITKAEGIKTEEKTLWKWIIIIGFNIIVFFILLIWFSWWLALLGAIISFLIILIFGDIVIIGIILLLVLLFIINYFNWF